MEDRESFESKKITFLESAVNHTIVDEVIQGDMTFTEHLDGLLDRMEFESEFVGDHDPLVEPFLEYASLLGKLGEEYVPIDDLERDAQALAENKTYRSISKTIDAMIGLGAISLLVPGGALIDIGLIGAGYLAKKALESRGERSEYVKVYRFACFATLTHLAKTLDESLCRAFIYDDFTSNSPRFERTYCGLDEDAQEAVEAGLSSLLEAGAFEMDDQQLEQYLADLRENGPRPLEVEDEQEQKREQELSIGPDGMYCEDSYDSYFSLMRRNPWDPRPW